MNLALVLGLMLAAGANSEISACRPVPVVDKERGQTVVGIEDFAYDTAAGAIYLSAYDRRAVAAALDRGEAPPGGAIYRLAIADLDEAQQQVSVQRMAITGPGAPALRPHGIAYLRTAAVGPLLFAINRVYVQDGGGWHLWPEIDAFRIEGTSMTYLPQYSIAHHSDLCSPNDLAAVSPSEILITNDHGGCSGITRALEDFFGLRLTSLFLWDGGELKKVAEHIGYANGVAFLPAAGGDDSAIVAIAGSRDRQVAFYALSDLTDDPPAKPRSAVHLSDAPDNLIVGDDGALYAAALPNFIQYWLFRHGEHPDGQAPSSVFRISDAGEGRANATRIWNDDGAVLSGASAALKIGPRLLVSAAYDDHIAICHAGADTP